MNKVKKRIEALASMLKISSTLIEFKEDFDVFFCPEGNEYIVRTKKEAMAAELETFESCYLDSILENIKIGIAMNFANHDSRVSKRIVSVSLEDVEYLENKDIVDRFYDNLIQEIDAAKVFKSIGWRAESMGSYTQSGKFYIRPN